MHHGVDVTSAGEKGPAVMLSSYFTLNEDSPATPLYLAGDKALLILWKLNTEHVSHYLSLSSQYAGDCNLQAGLSLSVSGCAGRCRRSRVI